MNKSTKFQANKLDFTYSRCNDCKHYKGRFSCLAFPDGIPDVIKFNEFDHKNPYPYDNGIRFEEVEKK
jgi:hypothetical protein